jgi:segregation and condensation protein B
MWEPPTIYNMTLSAHIESLLFWKNESVSISWLAKALEKTREEIEEGLSALDEHLQGRGIVLQRNGDEVALKTSPETSSLIEKFSKDELIKELTPSALETLSIIIYRGPIPKKEIDYIRGVNSGFILRNLLIRGLIQKEESREGRGILYQPTLDLLSLLGIAKLEDLEEYEAVRKEIEHFKHQNVET